MVEITTKVGVAAQSRPPLSKGRVLGAAVALADEGGVDALSMRNIAQALGVVPMALYKHVANKNELLDGMIDVLMGEIDPPADGTDWKTTVRRRVLSARRMLLRHPWAPAVIESRTKARATPTPAVMAYLDSMIGVFRAGGFSIRLVHHAMHVMGSRLLGFSRLRRALAPTGTLVANGGGSPGRVFGAVGSMLRVIAVNGFVRQQLRTILPSAPAGPTQEDLLAVTALIEAGSLTPVIDRTYPLADTAEGLRHLERGHTRGKIVITMP
ncbi:zinc-binding dehydrogenase [Streptomyces sp. NPDC057456]|uniref:zinc-binding dehydrogenase n=1 Tax=Streptomyces sp. NPDC057456 TaxID=3346139 RepID=UPI0036C09CC2